MSTNDISPTLGWEDDYTPSLEPGTTLAGKYRLIEEIGRGGMGVVWKANDQVADRLVALKFVPNDLKRYEAEMKRVRESFGKVHALHHSSICPLYSLESDPHLGYYLVMKFLEGETLDHFMLRSDPRRKGLPIESVVELLMPVAAALDYAHQNDVIHRDIKPSNIFLVQTTKRTEVQVIDFGLADEIKSSLSRVSRVQIDTSGTRPYMAPEQWRGRPQKAATDQYALAVVAYELLAGHLPFEGNDPHILGNAVLNFSPEPIRATPDNVNAALLQALAKDGSDRFESCTEFVAVLDGAEASIAKKPVPRREAKVPQPAAPGVESLMKRGHLFLEDSDWKQANDYFDRVLDIDPEYAPAYIGKLCAELKVQREESLGNYEKSIADFGNFKKAVRFADDEYRTKINGYDEKIRERLRQEQYDRLVTAKNGASEKDFPDLAKKFRAMGGYKDSAELANECDAQYRLLKERREEQERLAREEAERREQQRLQAEYKRLGELTKTAKTEEDWRKLAVAFRQMNGFRNTTELAEQCDERANKRREEQERLERERIARLWQNPTKAGERMTLPVKGVDYTFRWCPAGTFMMGSPASEAERGTNETQHQVTLSRGFWMLETLVTQSMWEKVTGSNPSDWKGAKLPVENVSWNDCQEFVKQLNDLNVAPPGYRFSLPTEAQWEYACRAGTTTPFNFGRVLNGDQANCDGIKHPYGTWTKGRYWGRTSEVQAYRANAWGLFDMHGNVWEWCLDRYGDYPGGSVTDPVGTSSGSPVVLRGGSWGNNARDCRSAFRSDYAKLCRSAFRGANRGYSIGVRLSLVPVE